MFDIICYLGGTCGDLVTAMIDSNGCKVENGSIVLDKNRQLLKKSWQFKDDLNRDEYLSKISKIYKSIPSHDTDYHLRSLHSFIAITVQDKSTALWASQRFKRLHRTHVWNEMQLVNQSDTIEKYAQDILNWSSWIKQKTNRLIALEDILNGCLEQKISSIINHTPINVELYHQWLQQINYENSNNHNQGRSEHQVRRFGT